MRVLGFFVRGFMLLFFIWLGSLLVRGVRVIDLYTPVYDPALEVELQDNSGAFGEIDRWAFPGMALDILLYRLKKDGYDCPTVQDEKLGGTPKAGLHRQTCTLHHSFPLPRDLVIQATVEYDHQARVIGVRAYSIDSSSVGVVKAYGQVLRALRIIEPAEFPVKGLSFSDSADLARLVADAIPPLSWRKLCGEQNTDVQCRHLGLKREQGLPAVPPEPIEASLADIVYGLGDHGLFPEQRYSTYEPVTVRLDGSRMWVDLRGRDFSGAMREVAILVEPAGAAPRQLLVRQGGGPAISLEISGRPTLANDHAWMWLLPTRDKGDAKPRTAHWLSLPRPGWTPDLERLSKQLADTDPLFMTRLVDAAIAQAADSGRAEQHLNLHPALQRTDRIAHTLRASGITQHLAGGLDYRTIQERYPRNPEIRAGWALALCERVEEDSASIDRPCWLNTASWDDGVIDFLRTELRQLKPVYADLPAGHPVQLRLERLQGVLPIELELP